MFFANYIRREDREQADKQLPRLMFEGLLLGGTGLGVLALIFEIAADAFSVAAYQTLLAIHGAGGYHQIAIVAFIILSTMLFWGIVPAYKAGAYLRPTAGGSGPLIESIGPHRMRWLSWIGTSLFFMDAILTIIISSISASDVLMLLFPEWASYRILLAEFFAFFIMAVLVAIGPKRAVPLFLLGGGAFTLFTILALTVTGGSAIANPQWAFMTDGIVHRLQESGVVTHIEQAQQDVSTLGAGTVLQLLLRSMSSAMLGFSGYEVIPASGKHAARPKWKVINTALTLAAIFLIAMGTIQLWVAQQWRIPATEGYSTLLIEYEIVATQTFGRGVDPNEVAPTARDFELAESIYQQRVAEEAEAELHLGDSSEVPHSSEVIERLANAIAFSRAIENALTDTQGQTLLIVAALLLAIILLLAQGGGYVGGAAVASNAARLGRLPHFFRDDRIGVVVIWGIAAIFIPIVREVVVVEAYYAFGFVSAFIITSIAVTFARSDVLESYDIRHGSAEARSLRFAGVRGLTASSIMGLILVTQKTEALGAIVFFGTILTLYQFYIARGTLIPQSEKLVSVPVKPGTPIDEFESGIQRAKEEARQRGVANLVNRLIEERALVKFNVEPYRIQQLVSYTHNIKPEYFEKEHEHFPEPSPELERVYQEAFNQREELLATIEHYSHYGIFTFIEKYYHNWVNYEHGRDPLTVQRAMISILFPLSDTDKICAEFSQYQWVTQPEPIWQFARERYRWAKDQWPNLSDKITTIWVLQEFGLISHDIDIQMIISVSNTRNTLNELRKVEIHTHGPEETNNGPEASQLSEQSEKPLDPPETAEPKD